LVDGGLVEHYEQLRAAALAGGAGGGHGLALLAARGMAAWIGAWRLLCPVPAGAPPVRPPALAGPEPVTPGGTSGGSGGGGGGEGMASEVVAVLAAMAAACLGR
jgi:hypothetical protein